MIVEYTGSFWVFHSMLMTEAMVANKFDGARDGVICVDQRYLADVVVQLAREGVVAFERTDYTPIEFNRGRWILLHWHDDREAA